MKVVRIILILLVGINLNAQMMETPKDVIIKLFVSTDSGDWQAVESTFDSSVMLDYSSMNGNPAVELSPEEIIDAWKGILPGFEHTHHQLGNFQIHAAEDEANVHCYGTATHYLTDDAGSVWTVVGTYDFSTVKDENGAWRIARMTFNFKYQQGNTALPQKAINRLKR